MDKQAQIKSKKRVRYHGEVFTRPREVNAMLDLVKAESESITARFLEPACGTGNFLVEIFGRKLMTVALLPESERVNGALNALCSIYGIDLLPDNVAETRNRILQMFRVFVREENTPAMIGAIQILLLNIIQGDFLTGSDSSGKPLVFHDYSGQKPVPHRLADMLAPDPPKPKKPKMKNRK